MLVWGREFTEQAAFRVNFDESKLDELKLKCFPIWHWCYIIRCPNKGAQKNLTCLFRDNPILTLNGDRKANSCLTFAFHNWILKRSCDNWQPLSFEFRVSVSLQPFGSGIQRKSHDSREDPSCKTWKAGCVSLECCYMTCWKPSKTASTKFIRII